MNQEKGFTLIELLVVIAIIGFLAIVILSWLTEGLGRGRLAAAQQTMQNVKLQAAGCLSTDDSVNLPNASSQADSNVWNIPICVGGIQNYPRLPIGWIYCNRDATALRDSTDCGSDVSSQNTGVRFSIIAQNFDYNWKITCGESECASRRISP